MKRFTMTILCVFTLLLFAQNEASAQLGMRTGFKLGRTQSDFIGTDIDPLGKIKANTGGVSLELNLILLSFQADVLYQNRGAILEDGDKTKLHYISIPVVVKKKFLPLLLHPYILAGPEWNYLLSGSIKVDDVKADMKKSGIGFVVGGGLEFGLLGKSAYVEGRYHWGTSELTKHESLNIKDRTASIYLGILF